MPTVKTQITDALTELAVLRESEKKYQAKFDKQVAPHEQIYFDSIKPFQEKFNAQVAPVRTRIAALEKEIEAKMLSTETADGGLKLMRVDTENLYVEATATARREVDAKAFFEAVEESNRNTQFWNCLSVLVGKTEKFLGSSIDAIASVKRSWKVTIRGK